MNSKLKAKSGLSLLEKHMRGHKFAVLPLGQFDFKVEDLLIEGPAGTMKVDMFCSGDPKTGAVQIKLSEKGTRPTKALTELKHLMAHLVGKGGRWSVSLNDSDCTLEYRTSVTYRKLKSTDIHEILFDSQVNIYRIAVIADHIVGGMSVKDALDEPCMELGSGGTDD
jgi:hypothetical protein